MPEDVKIKLPPGEVARAALVLLAVGLGAFVLWQLRELIFLIFLAVLLATAIEPIVVRLRRHRLLNTGTGVLIVYLAIVLLIALVAYFVVPALLAQYEQFMADLPSHLEQLKGTLGGIETPAFRDTASNAIDYAIGALKPPAAPQGDSIAAAAPTLLDTVLKVITVFVMAFYWLLERNNIRRALTATAPEKASTVNTVWWETEEKLGGWVRGQLLLVLIVGCVAGVGYAIIGVPSPILLGLLAGLGELVPVIGPFLGLTPGVVAALTVSPTTALITAVFLLALQQIEGYVLVPRIMSRTVGISSLTVVVGILAGAALFGLPGAIVAVPVAGAFQVILVRALGLEQLAESRHGPVEEIERAA